MQPPLKPLNPLTPQVTPQVAPQVQAEEINFEQGVVRLAMAAETIAFVLEKIAVKEGAIKKEDCSYSDD